MFWFKSCPRCGGDLYQARDTFGKYLSCLQCGNILSEEQEIRVRLEAAATRKDMEPAEVPAVAARAA